MKLRKCGRKGSDDAAIEGYVFQPKVLHIWRKRNDVKEEVVS